MKRLLLILSTVFSVAVAMSACSGMLDSDDKDEVEAGKNYQTFNDADNTILGIYGKFMNLAESIVVLNELRADLMEITPNATLDMAAIHSHTATADNKYCNLAPFYEVILNCNDALDNFDKMKKANKLSAADYSYRYADVATVRCWVYLQMSIHFGSVPYVTNPLTTIEDLKDEQNFPVLSFDEMITTLILCMESLPTTELSTTSPLFGETIDGYNLALMFLNKKVVLGDLYLWADRHVDAARAYLGVIEEAENKLSTGGENRAYKVDGSVWDETIEPEFQVCYKRYKASDMSTFRNKWKEIFYRPSTNAQLWREMITMISYSSRFEPQYPFVEMFAPNGLGKYQLRPTTWVIDSLWEVQVQRDNGFVFDGRGRNSSFYYYNGQPVVAKYLYDYYAMSVNQNSTLNLEFDYIPNIYAMEGKWFIYRAGLLHLRYAEAANRSGYFDVAHALLNNGIQPNYSWGRSGGDVTGVQYTGLKPDTTTALSVPYPAPFFLDARQTPRNTPYPVFNSPWRTNYGIRQRAWVNNATVGVLPSRADSIIAMEKLLLREAALECGFEGHRWSDMLRIAMRKNREDGSGTAYLNELLQKAKPGMRYITPDTWFLPRKYAE